jgi:hypothetical protein
MLAADLRGCEMKILKFAAMLSLLTVVFVAHAASPSQLRQQTELGMVVRGKIDIRPDGSVNHYAITDAAKIPAAVRGILARQIPQWKFEPVLVDGKAVEAHADATVRIVAKPDGDSYLAGIQGAQFFGGARDGSTRLSVREQTPTLSYPSSARGMSADVYITLKIGRDGKALDAIVRKVDLNASASDAQMATSRTALAESTLATVRQWTFNVPTRGKRADLPYWIGTLLVTFNYTGREVPYGHWRPYLPGPCTEAPWPSPDPADGSREGHGCDPAPAYADDVDSDGPKLLTPLMQ